MANRTTLQQKLLILVWNEAGLSDAQIAYELDRDLFKLPCSSLQHKPPLVAFPEADHSGRSYAAQLEKELLDLGRIDRLLETGRWFRRVSKDLTVSLGGWVYYVKHRKGNSWRSATKPRERAGREGHRRGIYCAKTKQESWWPAKRSRG